MQRRSTSAMCEPFTRIDRVGIFLIHSANTFEAMAGGQEELFENFAWLPTWEDCRRWLRERGTTEERVLEAWKNGTSKGLTDRETMYDLMLKILEGRNVSGGEHHVLRALSLYAGSDHAERLQKLTDNKLVSDDLRKSLRDVLAAIAAREKEEEF